MTEPRQDIPIAAAPPAPTAAAEAAEFVARIFAEVGREEEQAPGRDTPAAAPAATAPVDAPGAAAAELDAQALAATLGGLLAGRRVLVLGLGASGLAMARWCAACGAEVTVADTRAEPPQLPALRQELPQLRFIAGPFGEGLLAEAGGPHAVLRSPGLAPSQVAPVVDAARAIGVPVWSELDLFAQALAALGERHGYRPAVLAITGTNGKTTVTALTGQLLERAGLDAAVAGNIGPTLLDTLAARVRGATLPAAWVLELSSFQLDGVQGFEPTAAVVLNLTQDHLDWHGDMPAYAAAKARIFGERALMVLNREDPAVMAMLPPPAPTGVRGQRPRPRAHVCFGADLPRRPGDFGIEVVAGMAWLVRAHEAEATARRPRGAPAQGAEELLHIQRLMPAEALRIRGRHNATNALAALALAQAAGCALGPLLHGLREYRGEPHRVEPIAVVHEVEYVDDSKGTNVGATAAALAGLGAERRLVAILGGDGKGQDFTPLAAPVARHARAVVLIGRDAPQIRAALQGCGVPLLEAHTLPAAVRLAAAQARPGDAVLLSPACASWDMFDGYVQRAQVFRAAVQELAEEAGQPMGGSGA
ncbi:UDP-N-acetylmuramoyl-L-alanine--D-glutamate ligase [Melaminivora alkalimesophila]|uniref:UDP-N-acetylmuramoylalanine--D-glutamate ligase n=1 Tax=Melaminivora alkalimesophila TaxID=1165852 RepID=A0A317REK3_9BURK|nr:UDP-N-acetylmuramoyl-L-alanine--D-glutamate ligase [Melaminivora alkalimesophila]PWW47943.1 UDP-N-acetylmuramoylalanine--D-glutamate ligase [Melaminivora alkalimesophila]